MAAWLSVIAAENLETLDASQLRELVVRLKAEVLHKQTLVEKLTHENAVLKRLKFAARSERFSDEQRSLLEEALDADLQAVSDEIEKLQDKAAGERKQPKRQPLPAGLPRREIRHEPESTVCSCGCQMKRIGEDVAEKLDYEPGVFTVERHVRGKWACAKCEKLVQAPVPPHVIDKGLRTTGLLAQVLVGKFADHLPLYRQEAIFARADLAIPRSTLAQWVGSCGVQLQPLVDAMRAELLGQKVLHADETPVAMLDPGAGKTHRAYLWTYCSTALQPTKLVVFDFAEGCKPLSGPVPGASWSRRLARHSRVRRLLGL
jgi:transposase